MIQILVICNIVMLNWKLLHWNISILNLYMFQMVNNDIVTLMFSDIDPVNESTTREQYNGQSQFSATKRDWTTYSPADLKSRSNLTNNNAASDNNVTKKKDISGQNKQLGIN
ncbi:uncharacterized protein LOC126554214 [Aphis gossypii]|uniref:uncharacterized protein LOC126554214 n=1 Tax=Aphis gossypii TaxID=80765 RepID=UPI0021599CF3|nr:uncharacterized protein LOC126554214 [Aphis gossypii]